jgi:hypothetical protein
MGDAFVLVAVSHLHLGWMERVAHLSQVGGAAETLVADFTIDRVDVRLGASLLDDQLLSREYVRRVSGLTITDLAACTSWTCFDESARSISTRVLRYRAVMATHLVDLVHRLERSLAVWT